MFKTLGKGGKKDKNATSAASAGPAFGMSEEK